MKTVILIISLFFVLACESNNKISDQPNHNKIDTTIVDSLEFLNNQIIQVPSSAINWVNRANYFLRIGNLNDARIDYEQAIVLDSSNTEYRVKFANILIGFLELEGAKYNYEYALQYDSLNAEAYVGLGKIYAFIDNPGMATVYLNKAYSIDAYLPEAYFLEGLIYKADFDKTKREESWKRSKSSFQTAIEQSPNYYDAYIMLGVMNDVEDNDLALDYYNSALSIAPKSIEAWYNKGMYYQRRDKFEQAKYCYRKINKLDTTFVNAYYNQGFLALTKENDIDSAIYFYNKVIDIDSLSFKGYNDLGLAYESKKDNQNAIKYYKKAIEINPDFELAKKNLRIVTNQ